MRSGGNFRLVVPDLAAGSDLAEMVEAFEAEKNGCLVEL
jgi:hypothetical protein